MKKILIVDDSSFMRSILKDILNDKTLIEDPIEVHEAGGKEQAIKQFNKAKPDVILLDIVMLESEVEGIEFVKEIKNTYDVKKILVISSIGQKSILDECKELGIETYLQKPFDRAEVVNAVKRAIA